MPRIEKITGESADTVWEPQGSQQLRFVEVGQTFVGVLNQIDSGLGYDEQMRWMYTFVNGDEEEQTWLLYGTVALDRVLKNGDVGAKYRITYTGDAKTSNGYTVKEFDIAKAKALPLFPEA